jgi:hypothetical protein
MIACKNYLRFLQGRELLRKSCSNFLGMFFSKNITTNEKKKYYGSMGIIVDH